MVTTCYYCYRVACVGVKVVPNQACESPGFLLLSSITVVFILNTIW